MGQAPTGGGRSPQGFHERFSLEEQLGAGAFGRVYLAKPLGCSGKEEIAVKVVSRRQSRLRSRLPDRLHRRLTRRGDDEVAILRALPASEHLVRFCDSFEEEGVTYIVMERCTMGFERLLERMPNPTEEMMKAFFADMLTGISACHSAGIVHRDVKPDNFLVQRLGPAREVRIKLCDFGLASRASDAAAEELSGVIGTPPYMAPEMLRFLRYGAKVDVWALGSLAFVLLFGRWPHMPRAPTEKATKLAIMEGRPAMAFDSDPGLPRISPPCAAWLRALLRREPEARVTAEAALKLPTLSERWGRGQSLRAALRSATGVGAFNGAGAMRDCRDAEPARCRGWSR